MASTVEKVFMTWLCWMIVSSKVAISHTISSRFMPLPSPPPENSKLGVSSAPVNVTMSFVHLLYPRLILLNSDCGGEFCCGVNNAIH